MADLNSDGNRDLIIGEEDGTVNFYRGKSDGSLEAGIKIQANGSTIKVANNSSPLLTDWDNDGDLDLLVGQRGPSEYSSDIKIFINEGTKESYSYITAGSVTVGGSVYLQEFFRGQLDYADLDGDGLKDLIVANANAGSTKGNVGFLKNTGTPTSPAFSNWLNIQADGSDISMATQQAIASKKDARARVVDWDGDGVLDILVACDNIFFYKGSGGSVNITSTTIKQTMRISTINKNDHVSFTMPAKGIISTKAKVISMDGRVLKVVPCALDNSIISGSFNVPTSGIYLLQISTSSGNIIKKFTIN